MTNNFEDEETSQEHGHGEFVEHELNDSEKARGITGNLADAWRTKPLFKFMVLLIAVFAVAVAGFSFFGGGAASTDGAHLARPPNLKEAPGGPASPYMVEQTKAANKERSDQAIQSGGSAIPTPIGQASDLGNFDNNGAKDDPLTELRAETERLRQQQTQQQAQVTQMQQQQQQKPPEQFDDSLASAMQSQMKELMEGWKPTGIRQVTVVKPEDVKNGEGAGNGQNGGGNNPSQAQPKPIVPAGTVSYAQLLTEANSDVPGPILANIVSGPLAGARAIGGFQVSDGYEKYLVLRFKIADKKGKDYSIDAIALDPDTTLGGMATEVDNRYFVRVVLPAAAGFCKG